MKFESTHAETLPLALVHDLCAKGRTSWSTKKTLQKFVFRNTRGKYSLEHKQREFEQSAIEWAHINRPALEAIFITRSPRAACKLATETDRRMTPQNEKGLQKACYESQKDKRWWLKYCSHFRIIPDNHPQILLETYGTQDKTEKEFTRKYLQSLKEAKTETLKFIREVLQSENIPPDRPIRELIETLAR